MTDAPRFPAGWYADPENPTVHRWWDGARWTEARQPAHGVQAPPPYVPPQQQYQPQQYQPPQQQYSQPTQQHPAPAHYPQAPQQQASPQQPAAVPQRVPAPQHAPAEREASQQQRPAPQRPEQQPAGSPPPLPQYAPSPSHAAPQHPTPAAPRADDSAGAPAAYPTQPGVSDTPGRRDVATNTIWIWLVVLLPLVTLPTLFLLDWRGFLEDVVRQSVAPSGATQSWVVSWTAGSLLISLIGWIVTAAQIVFAVLDWRTLRRRGVERPFHWAWILFVLAGSLLAGVYVIGRSVVLRRRTDGNGMAPVWAWIGVVVVSLAVGIGFAIWLIGEVSSVLASTGLAP